MNTEDSTDDLKFDALLVKSDDNEIVPYRMQLNFTGAHMDQERLADIMAAVIEEAENRGIFFEFGHMTPMDEDDVIAGSPLDQVITGRL